MSKCKCKCGCKTETRYKYCVSCDASLADAAAGVFLNSADVKRHMRFVKRGLTQCGPIVLYTETEEEG